MGRMNDFPCLASLALGNECGFYSTFFLLKVWGKKKVKNLEDRFGINFKPGIKLIVPQKLQIFSAL